MTAAELPDWLPSGRDWRRVGEHRYQATIPGLFKGTVQTLLLCTDADQDSYIAFVIDADERPEIVERAWEDLADRLAYEKLPECDRPGCTGKGSTVMVVRQDGTLLGSYRTPGERLRFCPPDAWDIQTAAVAGTPIAGWLRADAVYADSIDLLTAAGDPAAYQRVVRERSRIISTTSPDDPRRLNAGIRV